MVRHNSQLWWRRQRRMRGEERKQRAMLVVIDPEKRVAKDHPLRRIKQLAAEGAGPTVAGVRCTAPWDGPSIPPERLLKASLLMALYTIRSERLFCEQLDYNVLFRSLFCQRTTMESFPTREVH